MDCKRCGDKLSEHPVKQGSDFFCSLECANLDHGIEPEKEEYYEEHELEGLREEGEEE